LFGRVRGGRAIGQAPTTYWNAIAGIGRNQTDLPGVRPIATLRLPAHRADSIRLFCAGGSPLSIE
jgi:hypothetical protein